MPLSGRIAIWQYQDMKEMHFPESINFLNLNVHFSKLKHVIAMLYTLFLRSEDLQICICSNVSHLFPIYPL